MFFLRLVFASIFIVCCLTTSTNGATLENDEVEALKRIGKTLGKRWNFDTDPCSQDRDESWEDDRPADSNYANNVTCDCSFNNNTVCHVVHLVLKAQSLVGTLSADIATLPFLEEIDLTRNYLSDSIPPAWGSATRLVNISLLGNRLTGSVPEELASLTNLTSLDLSFNRLSGEIPDLRALDLDTLFLNGNNFNGTVPGWILDNTEDIDVSYNNFTRTGVSDCRRNGVNLFSSISRMNNSGIVPCLSQINCAAEPLHSVYINCGGREISVNGKNYEADFDQAGPSAFYPSSTNWAFSSTGVFLNDHRDKDILVLENRQFSINGSKELYTNARLSPSSLTYYAFCLANASYTVILHFAEIQFTNDRNYSSLGRRIFDVYIQGKIVLKDFNIKEEAGGAGIAIVKSYTVNVTDGTLEIRFRWAGKGTTSIPVRSVHGPLISAISIFDPGRLSDVKIRNLCCLLPSN